MRIAIDIRKVSQFGVGTHIWNLVRNLSEIDHDNQYFLLGPRRRFLELGPLGQNFQAIDTPEVEADSFWNLNLRVPLHLRRERIDLLHVPHYEAPLLVPCRLVVTIHDCVHLLFPQEGSSKFENYRNYLYTKHVLRSASHVIAVSGSTRQDLINIFDLPANKVSVAHNALDGRFTLRHDVTEQKRVLERYQLKDPFVLYVGQIKPHKNIDRLIEAFAVLKSELSDNKQYKNLKLIIIGDEIGKHQYLRLTVVRSGVQQEVRFLGFVPSPILQVFYEAAVIFASPSLYEGFGLSPLEAMANSTPVIASNTSALPEVLEDAAILVNPENVFEIARAMKQVLVDQVLRQQAIEKGLKQVQKFSWDKTAKLVADTYAAVGSGGKVDALDTAKSASR
jgi:glycosyltransferase involved in cell wall biosynthesis